MSLKFGLYLVEQGIITCDQFCGLVKIQQEASSSAASLAIRKNILTIKQVAKLLDIVEVTPGRSFINEALAQNAINEHQAQQRAIAIVDVLTNESNESYLKPKRVFNIFN